MPMWFLNMHGLLCCVICISFLEAVRSVSLMCVSVPPTLLGSDEVKTLTVPVNGHLTLECLADSDPAPEIEWYKDEVKVQVYRRGRKLQEPQLGQMNPSLLTDTVCFHACLAGWSSPAAGWGSVPGDTRGQTRGQRPLQLCGNQHGW